MNINKNNIGNAGEYYVASKLSSLDCVTTVTLGRAEAFDLLVVSDNGKGKEYQISVKTAWRENSIAFPLNKKVENIKRNNLYYAFVKLYENKKEPDVWIVPSKFVARVVKESHQKFLANGGKDTDIRNLPIKISGAMKKYFRVDLEKQLEKYKNNYSIVT